MNATEKQETSPAAESANSSDFPICHRNDEEVIGIDSSSPGFVSGRNTVNDASGTKGDNASSSGIEKDDEEHCPDYDSTASSVRSVEAWEVATSSSQRMTSYHGSVASSSQRRLSVIHPAEGLSRRTSTAIVINYISAGYILLPAAFAQGGTLLASIIVFCVCFQSYLTSIFLLETSARAEALEQNSTAFESRYSMAVRHRKFEMSLLVKIFLGKKWGYFFTATTALDLYGITWAFCSVFASALADKANIPGIDDDYKFYVGIFILVTVPLSCTSILDQMYIQLTFLAARLFMVFLMIVTLAVAYAQSTEAHFGTQVGPAKSVPLADWKNIIAAIQTAVFSTAFQGFVPAIAGVSKNKKVLKSIFQHSVEFVFISNLVLGLMVAIYFGDATNESNNLNWEDYHGGSVVNAGDSRSGLSSFVSYYIVLFAAIDGLAVYPLISVSLGDILLSAWYGKDTHRKENNWKIRGIFRLLASLPQAVGALFVSDLGVLAKYAGIFTLLSYTACPSMLYITSYRRVDKIGLPTITFYSTKVLSSNVWAYLLLIAVVLVIIGVIVDGAIN